MRIIISERFYNKLENQVEYIARDKKSEAIKFKKNILLEIGKIPSRKFSYRKSDFFDDENIREMIFMGYRIVFEITTEHVLVFGFHKWEEDLKL